MRIRIIAVVAALGLLLSAGIATANDDEGTPRGDTLFNYGYDPQAQLFLHNTHATATSLYDCTLANGTLIATYREADGGVVAVESLTDKETGEVVSFDGSDYELADEVVAPADPVDYPGGDCAISGVAVGANGHINHGTFMKLFNELIDMQGRGCLNRWLAQSQLGKNEQHVNNTDFVAVEVATGDTGEIVFETAIATCDRGKKGKPEDHPGRGHAKADKTDEGDESESNGKGRPESPGNSDKAPGHNKES